MNPDSQTLHTRIAQLANAPRPTGSQQLLDAQQLATDWLTDAGWNVDRHPFKAQQDDGTELSGVNLIATHPDHWPDSDRPRFCVGAHIDSKPDSPGADDNASAVVGLVYIAEQLSQNWPQVSAFDLELVVFDLEENGMLGGAEHAKHCRENNIDLRGMVSLEMLGYYDETPGSQTLPRQLVGLYPDTGTFIAVVGNQNSTELIEAYRKGLATINDLGVETLQVPENGNLLQATRLSDHSPFWDAGYAALMITDTSFMRNPHYHMASDTVETLDMPFLQSVIQGSYHAVRDIVAHGF